MPGVNDGSAGPPQTPAVDGTAPVDSPDFTAVYRAHFAYVIRALRRLGVREADLPDLAHDVFVVVHRKLSSFDPSRPMKPWLFGIAFRTALDKKRRHASFRETLADDAGETHAATTPTADAVVEAQQAHDVVMRALDALNDDQRAVFVMHELEGLSMPEIADVIEAPLNTLYSRLRLARDAFTTAVRCLSKPPVTAANGAAAPAGTLGGAR
jgi:RNA polymerase sigma-70 factor (ECF subfamily)